MAGVNPIQAGDPKSWAIREKQQGRSRAAGRDEKRSARNTSAFGVLGREIGRESARLVMDFRRVAVTAITNKLVHAIMVHECLPI